MLRHKIKHTGATLIELIIAMVIITVALVGILSVVNQTTAHSADPVINHQAVAIAESYLEEILLLPVIDPDGSNAGETRATFDNVTDYHGLSDGSPKNQNNDLIADLSAYSVAISVDDITLSSTLIKEVTVSVTRGDTTITIKGYRATY